MPRSGSSKKTRQSYGKFVRPEMVVLDETAIVPTRNLISPAPNQFTHQLTRKQPYYFGGGAQAAPPDGEFPKGARVVLLVHDGGKYCRVVNEQGLYAEIEFDSMRSL